MRRKFDEGRVNPFSVLLGLQQPDMFEKVMHWREPEMQPYFRYMVQYLSDIKAAAAKHNAKTAAVSIPHGAFLTAGTQAPLRDQLLLTITPEMLEAEAPDAVLREACGEAGMPCIVVTEAFRARAEAGEERFYYPLDTHFTPLAHRVFAELLAPEIARLVEVEKAGRQPAG